MPAIIIPALNEEKSIGLVVGSVKGHVDRVIVVDNGSTDATVEVARSAGAHVVYEAQRGYGAACLRGIAELAAEPPDVVLFLDGDASDHPEDVLMILNTVMTTDVEMCLGSRTLGYAERGSLTPVQRFGNWLSTNLIKLIWGVHYTDLGPLRAIRWDALQRLNMQDRTWGWTVEMQIKVAKHGIAFRETPVRYRRRIGTSKISGTVVGSVRAGAKILSTIARLAIRR
ncbi:MAG: glycosyltransferase [Candidatus Kapabacteria bacterium]|nr:glycosyltransferase [Candidatus Kapabacteria bacterium]